MRCVIPGVLALALYGVCAGVGAAPGKSCEVSGASVNFGLYNPLSPGALDTTGSLTLECSGRVRADLSVGVGTGVGASYASGRVLMRSPGPGKLSYNLYADAARTQILGDGTHGSKKLKVSGNKTVMLPIYARMPAQQAQAVPGSYMDVVIVTVSY